jgi:NAD(P) transhydrogenase subunit alpha
MAAEQGGNCELTVPGEAVVRHGVTIVGYTDLASRLAKQSSTLYANNLLRLTEELCKTKDGQVNVNFEDDAIRGLTVIKDGEITWPAPPPKLPAAPPKPKAAAAAAAPKGHGHGSVEPMSAKTLAIVFAVGALLFWFVGAYAPASFLQHFTVTNAISSIIAIGALVQVAPPLTAAGAADRPNTLILVCAVLALVLTAINMFGGFAVTRRMLAMFRK